jgi:hypothetical protein
MRIMVHCQKLAETLHIQSTIILTSREKIERTSPKEGGKHYLFGHYIKGLSTIEDRNFWSEGFFSGVRTDGKNTD